MGGTSIGSGTPTASDPARVLPALVRAVGAAAWATRGAWRWSRPLLIVFLVVDAVTALTPALLVQAVRWLVHALDGPSGAIVGPLLAVTVLAAMSVVLTEVANLIAQRVGRRLQRHLTIELARTIAALPPHRIVEPRTQAAIQQCRDAAFLIGGLATSTVDIAGSVLTAVTLCASIWTINPLAGVLVALAVVPTLVGFGYAAVYQERLDPARAEERRFANYYLEQLIYQRSGSELSALGTSGRMVRLLRHRTRCEFGLLDRMLAGLIRIDLVTGIAVALLLGGALTALALGGSGGGDAAAGILGVISGIAATRGAGFAYGDLMAAAPTVTVWRRLAGSVPPRPEQRIAARVDEVRVEGVSVRYPGSDRDAVHQVSFTVRRGELVAVVGANGAGKTTCVNAVVGLVQPTEGTVRVDGRDAAEMSEDERLGHIGLLTQEFGRYELTVRDAVALGSPQDADDARTWSALDAAHAGGFVRRMPHGLDTQLGEQWGGVGLSGGQWQRLALARIHLRGAPVWILDEPTSSIDAETEQEIFRELQAGKEGRITLVVSHRAWTLTGMDRILVFDHGRIVEIGTFDQLMSAGGRFAQMFREQLTTAPG